MMDAYRSEKGNSKNFTIENKINLKQYNQTENNNYKLNSFLQLKFQNYFIILTLSPKVLVKMLVKEIVQYLESIAPPAYQEEYDNSGLITGHMQQEVKGVLISLDCLETV